MTLTEFLTARIAEDERVAERREWHDERCDAVMPDGEGNTYHCDCKVPERLLAECQAKRRSIELHGWRHICTPEAMYDVGGYDDGLDACPSQLLLALPYVDHPDCRQEWKP